MIKHLFHTIAFVWVSTCHLLAQQIPSTFENIDYLCTFGKDAGTYWGDDDHVQIHFIVVPKSYNKPFFIRIYDPDIYGSNDQVNNNFNTSTNFTIYGGKGCYTNPDARGVNPKGNYNSGIKLFSKTFTNEVMYHEKWFSSRPLNPVEGEYDKELDGYVFKIIAKGEKGDDGNMYRYFLSTQENSNAPVEGSNSFSYEITFRLIHKKNTISHLYPFIDEKIVSVKQFNFDFDKDGQIKLTTVVKKLHVMQPSDDDEWKSSTHNIIKSEHNTTIDYQIINSAKINNDMTVYLLNQYDEAVPFFSTPIGGAPKYKYKIDVKTEEKK